MLRNLDNVRKAKKVTLSQIANLLGYTRYQSISDKINGKTNFTFDEALLIHEVLFPEYKIEFLFLKENQKIQEA